MKCVSVAPLGSPVVPLVNDHDQRAQRGQGRQVQLARLGGLYRGREVLQDADVVTALELPRQDQRLATHLVQRVHQFRLAVGRVDIDQHQSGAGRGELGDQPFDVVRRPDADPVTGLQIERQQAGGKGVDRVEQLSVAPAFALVADHDGFPVAPLFDCAFDGVADRTIDERLVAGAADITHGWFHVLSSPCSFASVSSDAPQSRRTR